MSRGSPRRWLVLVGALYLSQGLPAGLIAKVVPAVARQAGLSRETIGLLSLAALPWLLKFLWAPWVDLAGAGGRRHRTRWILACQSGAVITLLVLATIPPGEGRWVALFALLLMLNLFSATQDIAADGLAVRLLKGRWLGLANSLQVGAYKVGLIVGGAGLLVMVQHLGWHYAVLSLALALVVLLWPVLGRGEPTEAPQRHEQARTGLAAALRGFLGRPGMGAWLAVLLTYKIGDGFGSRMLKPFLVDQGWSLTAVARLDLVASLAGLAGAVMAGWWLMRHHRGRALLVFGVAQAVGLALWGLAARYPSPPLIWGSGLFEQWADGLSTVALFTLMMDQCRSAHEGSDYTVQASMQLSLEGLAGALSGFSAASLGYSYHFLLSAGLTLAAIIPVVYWNRCNTESEHG